MQIFKGIHGNDLVVQSHVGRFQQIEYGKWRSDEYISE